MIPVGVGGSWELSRLVDLWLLAEQLETPKLQNQIMYYILQKPLTSYRISSKCIKTIYENTERGSPLRRVVADEVRNGRLKLGTDREDYHQINMDYLVQILQAINNHEAYSLAVDEEGFGKGEADESTMERTRIEVEHNWGWQLYGDGESG
jgi:hypothetical protein